MVALTEEIHVEIIYALVNILNACKKLNLEKRLGVLGLVKKTKHVNIITLLKNLLTNIEA